MTVGRYYISQGFKKKRDAGLWAKGIRAAGGVARVVRATKTNTPARFRGARWFTKYKKLR